MSNKKLIKPDLTRRDNCPIFGDTVTFEQIGNDSKKRIFTGVVSEWNVGGPQLWEVKVDGCVKHVYGNQILHIEKTGVIPECPTVD